MTFIVGILSDFIQNSVFGKIRIISDFFLKAHRYIVNTESDYAQYLINSVVMNLQKIYFVSISILFIIMIFIINKHSKDNSENINHKEAKKSQKIISFITLLCLIVIGTAPIILTVYLRFAFPTIILSFIVILKKDLYIKKKLYNELFSIGLFIGATGGLLSQFAFLYKMTNITNMIISVMVRSLFNMFFM